MTPRLFVLTLATAMAIAGGAVAAGYSSSNPAAAASDALTKSEMSAAIPLSKVSNPTTTLANAKVDDRAGNMIGPVKSVVTGKSGAPTAIHVDVGNWLGTGPGEHIVSMDAKRFTYVPNKNILLTRMTKAQVQKLPVVHG